MHMIVELSATEVLEEVDAFPILARQRELVDPNTRVGVAGDQERHTILHAEEHQILSAPGHGDF
jgi:hypothetical protein